MKTSIAPKPVLRVALAETDFLRVVGFRALLESEADLELISASLPDIAIQKNLDVAVVGNRLDHNLFGPISTLKTMRPSLPILVVGSSMDDDVVLDALLAGAKGYVFDGAPSSEFARAIRAVSQGSVWASRLVLSKFIELALNQGKRIGGNDTLTDREKQVLGMLVTGLSNREIGQPLGIVERTVKAHIAKMMRKVGVHNRIELSVHAVARELVSLPAN